MTTEFGNYEGIRLIAMGTIPLLCAFKFFQQGRSGERLQVFAPFKLKRRYTTKPTRKDRIPYYVLSGISLFVGSASVLFGIAVIFFRPALTRFLTQ